MTMPARSWAPGHEPGRAGQHQAGFRHSGNVPDQRFGILGGEGREPSPRHPHAVYRQAGPRRHLDRLDRSGLQLFPGESLQAISHRKHGDQGSDPDDDAERRKKGPERIGPEGAEADGEAGLHLRPTISGLIGGCPPGAGRGGDRCRVWSPPVV